MNEIKELLKHKTLAVLFGIAVCILALGLSWALAKSDEFTINFGSWKVELKVNAGISE